MVWCIFQGSHPGLGSWAHLMHLEAPHSRGKMTQETAWHVSSNVISGEQAVQTTVGESLLTTQPGLLKPRLWCRFLSSLTICLWFFSKTGFSVQYSFLHFGLWSTQAFVPLPRIRAVRWASVSWSYRYDHARQVFCELHSVLILSNVHQFTSHVKKHKSF